MNTANTAMEYLRVWIDDPVKFVRHVLRASPTAQQCTALRALAKPGAHVSIRSGHGTGKTTVMAWAVLWFLFSHLDCRVPCTAPSGHQLRDLLWAEIAKWHRSIMIDSIREMFHITAERIEIVGYEKSRFAVARTARKEAPEALQGFHGDNLLFLIDEASGVPENIFEVAEGSLTTPGARVLMASNPTRLTGYFHRSHTKDRASWTPLRWASTESPLVSRDYPKRIAEKYGKDSNVYRVRVLGDFPTGGDDVVIPLDLIERASANDGDATGLRRAGLDVARFGSDSTALVIRAGNRVTHMEQWHGFDTAQTVNRVTARFNEKLFDCIFVDVIGIGAGVADHLRQARRFPVYDVNVAESARIDQYMRLRDELWFRCREWFQGSDATLPKSHELIDTLTAQLSSPTFRFAPGGKLQVESKDEIKDAGSDSPDLADALCLTFADSGKKLGAATAERAVLG